MISGTAKKRTCYPVHDVRERHNLLSFHALTGCDTTSAFSGHGKKKCWKIFQNQPLLVNGIGRDGELPPIEQFVCHMYGAPEQPAVNHARLHLFGKAKKGLEMLPPTRDALELHAAGATHQAKICLQADQEHVDVSSPIDTSAWNKESASCVVVTTPIPDASLELVTRGCRSRCRTARCTCFIKYLMCTSACGCDAIDCCNPAGQYILDACDILLVLL